MNSFQLLLGSNSNAAEHVAEAMERLRRVFPSDIRFSEVLESLAISKSGDMAVVDGKYLNALCLGNTELPLDGVQPILKTMETEMGRKRGAEAKGLVAIDLDLVVWNGDVVRPWDVAQTYYQNCLKSLHHD